MWGSFLQKFNGKALLRFSPERCPASVSVSVATDASLKGFGGHWGTRYIMGEFPKEWVSLDIEALEMYAVLATVGSYSEDFKDRVVLLHCDNEALVHCLNKLTSKNRRVMLFMRPYVLLLLSKNIMVRAVHIRSEDNVISDSLSRLQVAKTRELLPGLALRPTRVPDHLQTKNWVIGSQPL